MFHHKAKVAKILCQGTTLNSMMDSKPVTEKAAGGQKQLCPLILYPPALVYAFSVGPLTVTLEPAGSHTGKETLR